MFTEGLDQIAINWIKEGSDVAQKLRSPLAEKCPIDSTSNLPVFHETFSYLSPKGLPPVKFNAVLLSPKVLPTSRFTTYIDSEDEVVSVNSDPDGLCATFSEISDYEESMSIDSDLFSKLKKNFHDEESHFVCRPLSRGLSKENLQINVVVNGGNNISEGHINQEFFTPSYNDHINQEFLTPRYNEQDAPSAPSIVGIGSDENQLNVEVPHSNEVYRNMQNIKQVHYPVEQSQNSNESHQGTIYDVGEKQMGCLQNNKTDDKKITYTTSVQTVWQVFIAYDACFRLCLKAWSRNCLEAPEFLKDECLVLRSAFGIQKFLLQPKGYAQHGGNSNNSDACSVKGRKVIEQIEVEVKRVRMTIKRSNLRATSSQRELYMHVGAEYIRQVTTVVKSHINSLKSPSDPTSLKDDAKSCLLQLQSSSEVKDSESPICLKPGSGYSHVFFPENQADALVVEILDSKNCSKGRVTIQISSLEYGHGELTKWWPFHGEDGECVGKIQLSISILGTSDNINPSKCGPVVETMIYDLVLEAALRAQNFHPKNLHMHAIWKWLLDEFADYYCISESYAKIRYLSYIMNIATPTKECLDLLYLLLEPVIKARNEKILTRQERSMLLECEEHIEALLATTFENYKSLDEDSATGLIDSISSIPDSPAPALVPAVKIFVLLHDILSKESQTVLTDYFLNAAAKRCKRYMLETEEFISSNNEDFLTDSIAISTAYQKMKILCFNLKNEIQADIKIHNHHVLPSSIDLPNIAASVYSTELCKRFRSFLSSCPPSKPSQHVTDLLVASADFERDLDKWKINFVHGGLIAKDLFHDYIMVWIQETRLHLLEVNKAEKVPQYRITTHHATSPFVENMYEQIKDSLNEYELVINRWPQYLLSLESMVADVERSIIKTLEKQYTDILVPLQNNIPKMIEKQVQKLTRRQSCPSSFVVSNELGTFLNTLKRMLDILHCRIENKLKYWSSYLTSADANIIFGEQMNGINVLMRKKYKKYMESIVDKLISNTQANRNTKLKKILEDTKETEGEADMRERMHALCAQLTDCIRNLHRVFSSRIFVAICRGFWDRMGQIVLKFLESIKENKIWYRSSDYALGILDDVFASEMQSLLGNSLQDQDLDPPVSVIEARSILC